MKNAGVSEGSAWFKSSFSRASDGCVEVRFLADTVQIRDSKYQGPPADQPTLTLPHEAWAQFLTTAPGLP